MSSQESTFRDVLLHTTLVLLNYLLSEYYE